MPSSATISAARAAASLPAASSRADSTTSARTASSGFARGRLISLHGERNDLAGREFDGPDFAAGDHVRREHGLGDLLDVPSSALPARV